MIKEYPLYFKIREHFYYAGTIRVLVNSVEIFYHFPWGSKTPGEFQNINTDEIDNWHLPDHISFHKDGRIHTKLKDDKKQKLYLEPIQIGINPFNLERGHFLPIYIESFYIGYEKYITKRFKYLNSKPENGLIFDIGLIENFSLLLISKCASVDPVKMTQTNTGLNNLTFVDVPIVISDFFTIDEKSILPGGSKADRNTELVIIVSRQTHPKSKPITDKLNGEGKNVNVFHLVPSLEHLSYLVDLN